MSTLRVSTIQDTAGSSSSTPAAIANGIAKAWVNFNGTGTVAIRAQYNVSSITDNGVGDYTVNFTTAFTDANYAVLGFADQSGSASVVTLSKGLNVQTASNTQLYRTRSTTGREDGAEIFVAIFR